MMRSTGAGFGVCARVLMTSLAANNILPFRIGDIMRVFTYASDLGAAPSAILSTVILEKLLDIFVVGLIFVRTMGSELPVKIRHGADAALIVSTIGLLILMFGQGQLEAPVRRFFAALRRQRSGSKARALASSRDWDTPPDGNCEGTFFSSAERCHLVLRGDDLRLRDSPDWNSDRSRWVRGRRSLSPISPTCFPVLQAPSVRLNGL